MHKSLFLLTTVAIISLSSSSIAQTNTPPSGQFGLGILTGNASGLEGVFAINQNMQVGTLFGLELASSEGASSTTVAFAPFFRYQFVKAVSPFLQAGFAIVSSGGSSTSGLFIGGGIAYYLVSTFGIHADIDIISLGFSPSRTLFGWGNGRVGCDWFF